jgi:hypothetical protein
MASRLTVSVRMSIVSGRRGGGFGSDEQVHVLEREGGAGDGGGRGRGWLSHPGFDGDLDARVLSWQKGILSHGSTEEVS